MTTHRAKRMSKSLRLGLFIAAATGIIMAFFAQRQIEHERRIDLYDVERRAQVLALQKEESVSRALAQQDSRAGDTLRPRMEGYGRLLGFAVYRNTGELLWAGKAVVEFADKLQPIAVQALQAEQTSVIRAAGMPVHVFARRLPSDSETPAGVLLVAHDVSYLDERATARFVQYGIWIGILTLFVIALVGGTTWFSFERPLKRLAVWMRRLRVEDVAEAPPPGLPSAWLRTETDRLAASFRAARSTGRALCEAGRHSDQVWTSERLRMHAVAALDGSELVVVSNREPYMHQLRDGELRMIVPAGGLVTALDPVLQACGGMWVAHGAGDADRQVSDGEGRLTVPPEDARYTLKRVWLSREEEQGYYYGFSNEGLWPLCHLAHERPVFRASDWAHYRAANQRFADAVLAELDSSNAVVLVQDYQLALVPRYLKRARPDLRVGLFWHIPWPTPEAFRICPWASEILDGMLGADLVGFHLQQYCNNFLESVNSIIESRLDRDNFAVELRGSRSLIRPFPISVQPWDERKVETGEALDKRVAALRAQYKLDGQYVAVGVDRIDYTKGIAERFQAIDRMLAKYPQYRGKFTFVQLGAPSRTHLRKYREFTAQIEALADEINWKYQTDTWTPIRLMVAHHDARTVHAFLRMAPMCIVSSLHDGMNLVAKEYVAARTDGDGVLVLSQFAGAARELADAIVINPYDKERFADAIRRGIQMEEGERRARMARMHKQVAENTIYRWAANFLDELAEARPRQPEPAKVRMAAGAAAAG